MIGRQSQRRAEVLDSLAGILQLQRPQRPLIEDVGPCHRTQFRFFQQLGRHIDRHLGVRGALLRLCQMGHSIQIREVAVVVLRRTGSHGFPRIGDPLAQQAGVALRDPQFDPGTAPQIERHMVASIRLDDFRRQSDGTRVVPLPISRLRLALEIFVPGIHY